MAPPGTLMVAASSMNQCGSPGLTPEGTLFEKSFEENIRIHFRESFSSGLWHHPLFLGQEKKQHIPPTPNPYPGLHSPLTHFSLKDKQCHSPSLKQSLESGLGSSVFSLNMFCR